MGDIFGRYEMRKKIFSCAWLLLGFFWLGCSSIPSKKIAVAEIKNTKDEDPLLKKLSIPNESFRLKNGLKVILSPDNKSPFVAVSVWYQVGSVNEDFGKTGLAHLFEHLMFEGTAHVQAGEHFKILESVGTFGLNASTNFERTNYYQTVPKSQLELALSLEASRMAFLEITQAKLDEQRAVVRREREQRFEISPYGDAVLTQWQNIFKPSDPLYGFVIGSHEDIEAAKLRDVEDFYDRFYGPSNATLALVGDFNVEEAKKLINKYFLTLPTSRSIAWKPGKYEPLTTQSIVNYSEKLGKLPLVRIQYITPALFKKGDAELDIAAHILAGNDNGRLVRALTRDKHLATSVSASQQSMGDLSVFTIDALLNPGINEKEALAAIDEVLADLTINPPTKEEIDRARNSIFTVFFFGLQNLGGSNGKAEILQSYSRYANDTNFIGKDLVRYQTVDQQSIVEAIKNYLPINNNRNILFAIPEVQRVAQRTTTHE